MLKPDAKGLISAMLPKLPPGSYRAEVAAYNGLGESPRVPAGPPSFAVTAPASASSDANHATHAPQPVADPTPGKTEDKKTGDTGSKKGGVGKRFWKVLVGDDDKP